MNHNILTLQWHVTDACDQKCEHCYIYRGKDLEKLSVFRSDMMKMVVDNFIDSCEKMDCGASFNITGGDPLLYPHIWVLIVLLKQ